MRAIVSLELVLDAATDAAVREEWAALADAGLPSQAHHTGASNRPHVTLLVRPTLDAVTVVSRAHLVARLPLPVTLGAPVLFGGPRHRVLARLVVPSRELLDLQAELHAQAGPGDDADHTVPGAWTPHVTLARRLPVESVGEALGLLADRGRADLAGRAVGIRRWDAATRTVSDVAGHGTVEPC